MNNMIKRSVIARISEIERGTARAMREALMGDAAAVDRLAAAEQEISNLRKHLVAEADNADQIEPGS